MISDTRVDRYYYIYDSQEHHALVLDRATGKELTDESSARAQLIDHVWTQCSPTVLRQFTRWCARQVGADTCPSHTAVGRLWAAAQRDDRSISRRVRRESADTVMLAMALGLSRGQPDAARVLVVHAGTHPDAKQAALDTAHMSERWAEFSAESDPAAAARAMRTRHVDWLLDQLPSC